MKLSDLKPAPFNPRQIDDPSLSALATSMQQFGDISGLVWNERNSLLVCGHQRLKALESPRVVSDNGTHWLVGSETDERFPIRVVDWDEPTHKAAMVAANSEKLMGTWMQESLDTLIEEVQTLEIADGLRLEELATPVEPEIIEDDVPEAPAEPATRPGDLWVMGEHRVLCGDSTKGGDVERLMGGEKAGLCFTSPPYAQQRDYGPASDVTDWDGLMCGVFANLPMADEGQVLVNLGLIHRDNEWIPYWDAWIEWMRSQGWRRFGWYVWDQGFGLPGNWNGRLGPSYEFVFHFNRIAIEPHKWVGKQPEQIKSRYSGQSTMRQRDGQLVAFTSPEASAQPTKVPDNVIRVGRQVGSHGHPAQFPVAFVVFILRCWNGITFDPFLGSGTTLIAAHQLDRRCYGIEIEPRYVDVACRRWLHLTNESPVRESDGAKFSELTNASASCNETPSS